MSSTKLHKSFITLSIFAIGTSGLNSIKANETRSYRASVITDHKALPVREFKGKTPWGLPSTRVESGRGKAARRVAELQPTVEFDGLGMFDYLTAPDGSTWFYTTDYEMEVVEVSEWYTESYIKAYTFTIYDSSYKKIGEIKDRISLAEGETRVAHAVLDPSVSQKFFNSDEKYEVMVYLAMNTSEELAYQVNYYNKVYSIGGEKDSDGNDISIGMIPGRCIDTFNTGDGGKEEYYYTFANDYYPDFSQVGSDYEDFLEAINSAKTVVKVYSAAETEDGPVEIFEKEIFLTRYPGDTTDGIYLITKNVNGKPYFVFSQYEKPYFLDPTGFATDENATPDNSLMIETYRFDGEMTLLTSTRIPVEIKEVEGQVAYTFYSIGSVAWGNDIDVTHNGTPQAPAFIVAKDFTTAANLDEVSSAYTVVGNDGKLIHTIAEDTDGLTLLNSEKGDQPHAMLVTVDETDNYTFHFVDLYDNRKLFSLPQESGDNSLTAVCERVAMSDGKYKYAFEMQFDTKDDEGNDIKRVAWYNQDGTLDRVDHINMLKDVQYAAVNMYPECLSPHLYDDDDAMEYAVLVKRTHGATAESEFLIVDDNGQMYAQFTNRDGRGLVYLFSIIQAADCNRLQMVYIDDDAYNVDVYELPFLAPAYVELPIADTITGTDSMTPYFDGESIAAPDCKVAVYNGEGVQVAAGTGKVSLSGLPHGIYIAVVTGADGKTASRKISY